MMTCLGEQHRKIVLRTLLMVSGIVFLCGGICRAKEEQSPLPSAEEPPNIVLLIGDDHGWPYYGFMGSDDVETPNLDRLAREGTVFPLAHSTCSVCRPALLTLLTGLYPQQYYQRVDALRENQVAYRSGTGALAAEDRTWGLFSNRVQRKRWSLAIQNFHTLPKRLAERGYVSFEGGKFWEGGFRRAGFTAGTSEKWTPQLIEEHGLILALAGGRGLTFGRESLQSLFEFIDQHYDHPFFVWFAPMLPHTPHNPPTRLLNQYQGRGYSESAEKYYANCTWFDETVGQLLEFLNDRDLRDNTLLVYINDNGWQQGPQDAPTPGTDFSLYGGPLGKNSLHDMGFRTPVIFNRPGKIQADTIRDDLVSMVDIYPTILDFAEVQAPHELPGKSLRPTIEEGKPLGREHLIGSTHQLRGPQGWKPFEATGYYLRSQRWHYITCPERGIQELYDMQDDPAATLNVAPTHQDVIQQFDKEIDAWRRRWLEEAGDS